MKRTYIYLIAVILGIAALYYFFGKPDDEAVVNLTAEAVKEDFLVTISASGELKAKNSLKIRGPQGMRSAGIWQTSIKDLIPEGTDVKKGDFVASLDKTEIETKITELSTEIEREETKLEQIKIDTAIQMKAVRDDIANLKFDMAQEKLEIEKNKYEPQMVIMQSELKLQNSQRTLEQTSNKIDLLKIQAEAKVKEIVTNIKQFQNKMNRLSELAAEFTIMAPEDGMLIYENSWDGKKGPGSQVGAWDPVVAQLPDLSKMVSTAYVNEVDISKIKKGQTVEITVDAFPEKTFTGQITSVANIGQELKGQDAKVFEISIDIEESDDILKPAMTTTNKIKIYEYKDVFSIPLEAFKSDSLDYVYLENGLRPIKQQVIAGPSNENNIIIVKGVEASNKVMLIPPDQEMDITRLSQDAITEAENTIKQWSEEKEKYDNENQEKIKALAPTVSQAESSSTMIIFN